MFLLAGPQAVLGGRASALGAAEMLGATLSYALATVYLRWARPPDTAAVALGQQACAAVPAAVLVLLTQPLDVWALPAWGWASLAGLAMVGTALPIVLHFRLVALAPAGQAAMAAVAGVVRGEA